MKTEAKERPIIFSTPMVQAIRAGKKIQTRRIVKAPYQGSCEVLADKDYPYMTHNPSKDNFHFILIHGDTLSTKCPHGSPGDVLYIKETLAIIPLENVKRYIYKADLLPEYYKAPKWIPSIFMPKEASRIKLLIEDVLVERLNDISEEDAIAEGVNSVEEYIKLWESLHGPDSWSKNPWVWVLDFKILEYDV